MIMALFFVLIVLSLIYIISPLIKDSYWPYIRPGVLAEIEEKKKEGIWGISDLDFEYEMGKLTKEDYQSTRELLKTDTLPVLKKEKDYLNKFGAGPAEELPEGLKDNMIKEVLRICGKRLSR